MRQAIKLTAGGAMLAIVLGCLCEVTAAERNHVLPQRTWRSKAGDHAVAANLLESKQGKVLLRKSDGKHIWVALTDLCDSDQRYVKTHAQNLTKPSVNPFEVGTTPPKASKTSAAEAGQSSGEMMYGVQWHEGEQARRLASAQGKPVMWFRVLGDLEGFM